jgi:hypothetical protein
MFLDQGRVKLTARTVLGVLISLLTLSNFAYGQYSLLSQKDGAVSDDRLGWSVSGAGDVNGDGVPDYVVGAPYADPSGLAYAGTAIVYSGASGAVLYEKDGTVSGELFGSNVSGAGDINNDGRDDFIVAGDLYAVVYSGDNGSVLYQKTGGGPVGDAGDINGDGHDDFLVSNYALTTVFSGSDGSVLHQKAAGSAVAGIGDVNSDGKSDFLVSDQAAYGSSRGAAYVYSGVDGSLLYEKIGPAQNMYFGSSLAGAGDINGDGTPDFIIGARLADIGAINTGAAYVYSGATGDLLYLKSGNAGEQWGQSVAGAGDADGDGRTDFLIGSSWASPGGVASAGSVFLYSGLNGSLLEQFDGQSVNENLGFSVARIGDINGNNNSDFAFSSPNASPGGRLYAGSAFIYGNGAAGDPCASDNVSPSLVCSSDKTAGCDDAIEFDTPTASDNCDPTPSISIVSTVENPGPGADEVTHTRTWQAADASGNVSAVCSQNIVYFCEPADPCASDSVGPTLLCSSDKAVGCGDAIEFDAPIASDNCDPSPSISIVSTVENPGPGADEVTHTRTWQATDASGNVSELCSQSVVYACDATPEADFSQITTHRESCDDFVAGSASGLSDVCYQTRKDKISKCTPGSFKYYVELTAPKAHFTVDIIQTRDGVVLPYFDVTTDGIEVYDDCSVISAGTSNSPGQAQVTFNGATAGKRYVISVEYNAATLTGIYVDPNVVLQHHDFSAEVDGTEITRDPDGISVLGCGPSKDRKKSQKISGKNYPNPFNPTTTISYYIEQDAQVKVTIYNMLGQQVVTLVDEFGQAGDHTVIWNGRSESGAPVASGVYFLKIAALDETSVTKMNLLK